MCIRDSDYLVRHHDQILSSLGSSFVFSVFTVLLTLFMCLFPAAVFARVEF